MLKKIFKLISAAFGTRLIAHALEHFIKALIQRTHVVQSIIVFVLALRQAPIVITKTN